MPEFIDQLAAELPSLNAWEKIRKSYDTGGVLYYFSAEGCNFCSQAFPWVSKIEEKYKAKGLRVIGVDINKNSDLGRDAGVTGVPVLVMTENGSPINRVVGWGDQAHQDVEVRLGLTDLYNEPHGLPGAGGETTVATSVPPAKSGESTCAGCDGKDNIAIAQLAEGISAELEFIKNELAEIKSAVSGSK